MARVNNLSDFLTDVASAIKTKKGSKTAIPAVDFDTEILALPSQGVYQTKVINIDANGSTTVLPDEGYDAIEGLEIITNVPEAQLQEKTYTFTTNQTIEILPDTGYDGFSSIKTIINVEGGGGDDPAVNAILWSILGYDQAVFNILKRVIPIEQQFVAIGGTDAELYSVLENIYEGGNE